MRLGNCYLLHLARMNYCHVISLFSHQKKTPDMDPFSAAVEPPAKRLNVDVLSTDQPDDDTVEIEL